MWTVPTNSYRTTVTPSRPQTGLREPGSLELHNHSANVHAAHHETPNGSSMGGIPSCVPTGIPDPPVTFHDLENMPLPDLQAMAAETARFQSYIERHEHSKRVDGTISALRREVDTLEAQQREKENNARETVSTKHDVATLMQRIERTKVGIEELKALKDDWLSRNSEQALVTRLRGLVNKTEEEGEMLVQQLHSGTMEYNEFMPKYITCQRKLHERKTKLQLFEAELNRRTAPGTQS